MTIRLPCSCGKTVLAKSRPGARVTCPSCGAALMLPPLGRLVTPGHPSASAKAPMAPMAPPLPSPAAPALGSYRTIAALGGVAVVFLTGLIVWVVAAGSGRPVEPDIDDLVEFKPRPGASGEKTPPAPPIPANAATGPGTNPQPTEKTAKGGTSLPGPPKKNLEQGPETKMGPVADGKPSDQGRDKTQDSQKNGTEKNKNLIVPFLPDEEIVARVKKAGGKIGKVTVSLAWKNYNDLDLHVLTSQGEDICFHRRRSSCGGLLDVDQNVFPNTLTPVENVFWPTNSPPKGPLKVYVHHYRNHRRAGCQDPTLFVVRVQIDGEVKTYEGSVSFKRFTALPVAPSGMVFVADVLLP